MAASGVSLLQTMISDWLGERPLDDFLKRQYRREPLAQPKSARRAIPLLTWEIVGEVLAAPSKPEVLLASGGKLEDRAAPRSLDDVRSLFGEGVSFIVRQAELHHPVLRWIADSFAAELDGDVTIQLFGTPSGFHGFGWHYDCEDVFIAQTAGAKRYFLRRNTVNPEPHIASMPRDMQYGRESSPLLECVVVPGDLLYVPSGWWHRGEALEDSLTLSVGVLDPRAGGRSRRG